MRHFLIGLRVFLGRKSMNKLLKSWVHGAAIAMVMGLNMVWAIAPALAETARDRPPQNQHDPEIVASFIEGCVAGLLENGVPEGLDSEQYESLVTDLCGCMIWEIQDRYTQEEADVLSDALERNEEWANDVLVEVVNACMPG